MAKQSGNGGSGHLSRGSNVEVRSEEEGFNGAWFPATIIEPPSNPSPSPRKRKSFNSNKVLVQYDTFVSEDDPSKPLIEHTNVMFVRPSPPVEDAGKKFEPGDHVDAFHNDAWWPGLVMSVEGDRYTVGFKNPPELLVLGRNELRTRLDWHNGVWSRAPKERMKGSIYSPGTPIEVNLNKNRLWYAWIPASYAGQLGGDSFLVQYKSGKTSDNHGLATVAVADHQIRPRPRPPPQEETNFCLMDKVDAFHDMGWWVGDITKVLTDKKYIVTFRFSKEEKEFTCSQLRRHYEWIARKWRTDLSEFESTAGNSSLLPMKVINEHDEDGLSSGTKAKGEKHKGIGVVVGVELPNSKVAEYRGSEDPTRNGTTEASAMEVQVTVPGLSAKPAAHDQLISLCVDEMHSEYTMECSGIPAATTNQQIPVADAGLSGKTPALDQPLSSSIDEMHSEKTLKSSCSEDPTRDGRAEASAMEVWEDGAEISAKKPAEDQPLSFYIDGMDSENTMKGSGNQENLVSEAGISIKTPAHDQSLPLCIDKVHSERTMEGSSSEDPTGDGKAEASAMEIEVAGAGISAETPPHDKPLSLCIVEMDSENSVEGSGNPAGTANQQSPVNGAGISANEPLQDQPLSLCIGERYSGKTMEGSSNPAESANQQYEVRGRRVETGITGDIEREEGPHLPFVKKSPFWKMLESMDAFKRFPQQPHFKPFLRMKMVCREALALGGMHLFSSLVEYTSQLQVDDLSDSINDILEALVELERLGFDVKALRNHLNKLQDMKLRFEQLKNKLNLVEIQITNCRHERSKGSEVISGLDKEINDLEEQIRGIQEKRAKAESERAAKDSEISAIQSEANVTESIQSIEHDFQNLAAAAW